MGRGVVFRFMGRSFSEEMVVEEPPSYRAGSTHPNTAPVCCRPSADEKNPASTVRQHLSGKSLNVS